MNVVQPSSPGYISRPRSSLSNNRLRLSPLNHEQFDLNEKYKKQAIIYEKLINSPKYSNVNWPILSETETSFSLDHDGTKYFINPNRGINEYDISAVSQGKIVYFKVQSYFPLISYRNQDTVIAFVNDNEEVFYLNNFD